MKFSVLSSSSSGNCTLLEDNQKFYLIDCGLSLRAIIKDLNAIDIFINHLDGIFITHEHIDHTQGLASVVKKFNCPIYMSKLTYKKLSDNLKDKISPIAFSFFKPEEEFIVNSLKVLPFRTLHDAIDPVGFRFIDSKDKVLVYITDTGSFQDRSDLENADCYIIESNHEPNLLLLSNRPWELKNRIMSEYGHLSNEDSAKIIYSLKGPKTKKVILFHLSNECNTKELALTAYKAFQREYQVSFDGIDILASDKNKPMNIMEV